jgi:hypothetical protein
VGPSREDFICVRGEEIALVPFGKRQHKVSSDSLRTERHGVLFPVEPRECCVLHRVQLGVGESPITTTSVFLGHNAVRA